MSLSLVLIIIILSSLFIYGWSYCTIYTATGLDDNIGKDFNPFGTGGTNKEIAWWFRFYIGNFIYKYTPKLKPLLKPLFMCEICMSSIYGSIIYWLMMVIFSNIAVVTFILYPIVIISIAGLNRVIKAIMQH